MLEEVFAEVAVDTSQIDFWADLLAKARRSSPGTPPDYAGGAMILPLLAAFCARGESPLTANQNLLLHKLVLSPASASLERVQLVRTGTLAERPTAPSPQVASEAAPTPGSTGNGADSIVSPEGGGGLRGGSLRSAGGNLRVGGGRRRSREVEAAQTPGSQQAEPLGAPAEAGDDGDDGSPPPARSLLLTFREASLTPLRSGPATPAALQDVPTGTDTDTAAVGVAAADGGGLGPEQLFRDVLSTPALLCVVARREVELEPTEAEIGGELGGGEGGGGDYGHGKRRASVLCLSPTDPRHAQRPGKWIPLCRIDRTPGLLDLYLAEVCARARTRAQARAQTRPSGRQGVGCMFSSSPPQTHAFSPSLPPSLSPF